MIHVTTIGNAVRCLCEECIEALTFYDESDAIAYMREHDVPGYYRIAPLEWGMAVRFL